MNKKFCSKLAEKVNGFYFVSKFKLARILVATGSDEELLKGVCVKGTSSGVSILTWFCPITYFSYPNDPLIFMTFEGWDFGGNQEVFIEPPTKVFIEPPTINYLFKSIYRATHN